MSFLLLGQPIYGAHADYSVAIPEKPDPISYSVKRTTEVFGADQWVHLDEIIKRESKWNHKAQNPHSTAYGLCQFLNSTWKSGSFVKTDDPHVQIEACLEYIKNRYGTPEKALKFHNRIGWF